MNSIRITWPAQYSLRKICINNSSCEDARVNEASHPALVAARKTWLEFCKKCSLAVPESNPIIMIAMSSMAYSYLLDQASETLTDETPSDVAESMKMVMICTTALVVEQYVLC